MNYDKYSSKIQIVSEPSEINPYIIIYKPQGIPSAPLSENDKNCAFFQAAMLYPQILTVKGKKEIEGGLIHRLDTVTDGLLLIATTQDSYDKIIRCQKDGNFIKTYSAICSSVPDINNLKDGFSICECGKIVQNLNNGESINLNVESFFRPFGPGRKEVRPVLNDAGKAAEKKSGTRLYSTQINIQKSDNQFICKCRINNGYRHQVRCHLAWCGLPVKGDPLYNPEYVKGDEFFFSATSLEFIHPLTGRKVIYSI